MSRYLLLFLLTVTTIHIAEAQQKGTRPTIGIALSGGGAKGLAHIGILKALDSAGLKVNYITGTSMGGILGALYASGYSGDSIEMMARKIDWDLLLSNSSNLRSLIMEEKSEYGKYAVELPFINNKFLLPSGVLESQELWLKFNEFFFPVYTIKDFSKLPKAFKCVATDVSTGEMVVLDKGELTYAVRSSMAIPSVFTAVDYNNKKLVDGGLVRNFPVTDVKNMGADFIIGSSVSGDLLPKEKINNILDVMLQIIFFREDADSKKEKQFCDLYISQPLDKFSMGSFSSAKEIIDAGVKKGRELYPQFKHLADSLNTIYGTDLYPRSSVPKIDSVYITEYQINGLRKTSPDFFLHRMQFQDNQWYTAAILSDHVRKAFGTRYYNKIIYSLVPLGNGTTKIIFDVEENPLTFAKLGINYNSFTGISLIGNLTSRNFLTPYSRSMVTVNIGENMRIRGEHLQYFGRRKSMSLTSTIQAEDMSIDTYTDFLKTGLYKQGYFMADEVLRFSLLRKNSFGIGTRFEGFRYKPSIAPAIKITGTNSLLNSYFTYSLNTLSNTIYPKKGAKINIEVGYSYNQAPDLDFYRQSQPISDPDSAGFSFANFTHIQIEATHFIPITDKYTFQSKIQADVNFNQHDNLLNSYFIGGLNASIHNQVTFVGLNEGTITSGSVGAVDLGVRYQMYPNLFLTGHINSLVYDFIPSNKRVTKTSFLSGYGITLGYNFVLGPLEISAMYCDQSRTILPYVNLGIPF